MELSNTLKCSVEKGQFGYFVRLTRGNRWIVYSPNVWKKIVDHVPRLDTEQFELTLTDEKDVKVVTYEDKRYVCFHRVNKQYHTYINMNVDEWTAFKAKLSDITFPKCTVCQKRKHKMVDGRMKETTLTPEQLADIKENNQYAYNQLAYQCEYCGVQYDYGMCHCHRYDCRDCEPDNFCSHCDELMVECL